MNNPYVITQVPQRGCWSIQSPEEANAQNRLVEIQNRDIENMLKEAFAPYVPTVLKGYRNAVAEIPLPKFSEKDSASINTVTVEMTEGSFIRFNLRVDYRKITHRVIKMVKGTGNFWNVDREKANTAAQALVAIYEEKRREKTESLNAMEQLRLKETAEFSALVPELAAKGIAFDESDERTGVILLGEGEYGLQIQVTGNKAVMKGGKYGDSFNVIDMTLLPELVALLKKNSDILRKQREALRVG